MKRNQMPVAAPLICKLKYVVDIADSGVLRKACVKGWLGGHDLHEDAVCGLAGGSWVNGAPMLDCGLAAKTPSHESSAVCTTSAVLEC